LSLEKLWLYISLFLLLVLGLSLINLTVFLEVKNIEEEHIYRLAYQSFTIYLHNKEYKGDERVVINPFPEELYRVYVFDNPLDPFKSVKVGIKKEYLNERINQLMKRLLIVEFSTWLTSFLIIKAPTLGHILICTMLFECFIALLIKL